MNKIAFDRWSKKEGLEDYRICGDCVNATKSPCGNYPKNNTFLCEVKLIPVQKGRSVNYCEDYAIRG